jgi:hypothetical protein
MSVITFRDSAVTNQCIANTSVTIPFDSFIQLILNSLNLGIHPQEQGIWAGEFRSALVLWGHKTEIPQMSAACNVHLLWTRSGYSGLEVTDA